MSDFDIFDLMQSIKEAREDEARKCCADVCEGCRAGRPISRRPSTASGRWYHPGSGFPTCLAGPIHERLHREKDKIPPPING